MSGTRGAIHFEITADNEDLKRKLAQSRQAILDSGKTAEKQGAKIEGMFKRADLGASAFMSKDMAKNFGMQLIEITSKLQTFEAVLTDILQSPQKAQQAMSMLQDFAATTPFQVDVLTGAFVKLANQGFIPTYDQMTKLGDLASFTGKNFDQLAEAIIDAQTGEFERLKEFGILASEEGNKVTLLFQEQKTQVDFTASAIRDYILSLGDLQGVAEANAKIAETLTDQYSNLQDVITQMMTGLDQSSEGTLPGALSGVSSLVDNYEQVSAAIENLIDLYDTYKATVIVLDAMERARLAATLSGEVELSVTTKQVTAFQALRYMLTTKLKVAQDLLNMVTAKNQYIKIGMVIAKLVVVAYNLVKAINEETEAERALREEQEGKLARNNNYLASMAKEQAEVDMLFGRLKALTTGTKEYNDTKDEIISKYGKYLKGMSDEITSLKNIEGAYKAISEAAVQAARDKAISEVTTKASEVYSKKEVSNLINIRNQLQGMFDTKRAEEYFTYIQNNIKNGDALPDDALNNIELALRDKHKSKIAYGAGSASENGKEVYDFYIGSAIRNIKIGKAEFEAEVDGINSLLNGMYKGSIEPDDLIKLDKIISAIKTKGAELKRLNSQKEWTTEQKKDIERLNESLETLKKQYKSLTGLDYDKSSKSPLKSSSQSISDQAKANEARIKAEQDLKQTLLNVTNEAEQAVIDAKEAGFEKEMAQIDLNYRKKLTSIEMWEREQRKAVEEAQKTAFVAEGGDEKSFVFDPNKRIDSSDPNSITAGEAVTTISSSATAQRNAATMQGAEDEKKIFNDLRTQWQSWGDEYQQIEEKITKIKQDATQARKEIQDRLNNGDINLLEASQATGMVDTGEAKQVGDLESQKTKLSSSWTQLFRDLEGLSRREVNKLISEINDQLANEKLAPADASALLDQLGKAKDYSVELNPFASLVESLGGVNTATQNLKQAKEALKKANESGTDAEKEAANENVESAQKILDQEKQKRNESASKSIGDVSSVAGATSDLLKNFGIESPAVDGVVNSLAALGEINFGNPISVITGGLKAVSSLLGGIFGEMDNVKEKKIQQIQDQIDELEKSYDKLGKVIDMSYSTSASSMIKDQDEMLQQQKLLIDQQIAEENGKKKTDHGRIEEWRKEQERINDQLEENKRKAVDVIFGSDLQSAIDDFASAYMDAWASGEDRAAAQKDVVKNMLRGIIQEMLKADIAKQVEVMRNSIAGFIDPEKGGDNRLDDSELAQIEEMGNQVGKVLEERSKMYDKILKDDTRNEDSLAGQIRGTIATEQSVSELGGIMRRDSDNIYAISMKLDLGFVNIAEMARTNALIEANTRRTADNTEGLIYRIDDTNKKLDTVIKNTQKDYGKL